MIFCLAGSDFVLYGRSSCRNVTLALSEAGRELLIVEEGAGECSVRWPVKCYYHLFHLDKDAMCVGCRPRDSVCLATHAKQLAAKELATYSPPPIFPFPHTQCFLFPVFLCCLILFSPLLPPLPEDNHVERVRLDHIDVIRKGFSHGGHMRAVTYHPLKSLSIVVRRRRRHDTMKTYNLRAKNAWLCQM